MDQGDPQERSDRGKVAVNEKPEASDVLHRGVMGVLMGLTRTLS